MEGSGSSLPCAVAGDLEILRRIFVRVLVHGCGFLPCPPEIFRCHRFKQKGVRGGKISCGILILAVCNPHAVFAELRAGLVAQNPPDDEHVLLHGGIFRSLGSGRRAWNRLRNPAEKNLPSTVRSFERRKRVKETLKVEYELSI